MKAMILAAGRGQRMKELTDNVPKPLLVVGKHSLIEWQILQLKKNGFDDIVINVGYLGQHIETHLGSGNRYGVSITYSREPQAGLETGGGVFQALPLLGDEPFLLTNADVFSDFPYACLRDCDTQSAHLVLVDNPEFNKEGDFSLQGQCLCLGNDLTFSGISVVSPQLFANCQAGFYPIAPLFHGAIKEKKITGEYYSTAVDGFWFNVGTPEQLAEVNRFYG